MIHTVYDVEQRSDEWRRLRCGIVTASTVGKLLTVGWKTADNATSRGLVALLAAERITGRPDRGYEGWDMVRGQMDEPLARDMYAKHLSPVTEVGFVLGRIDGSARLGYSPDGFVGDDGLIEVKSRLPKHHLDTVITGRVPDEYLAQIQCGLLVTGRAWCDYVSYSGGMAFWAVRVLPDPHMHTAILDAVRSAEESIARLVETYEATTEGLPIAPLVDHFAEIEVPA